VRDALGQAVNLHKAVAANFAPRIPTVLFSFIEAVLTVRQYTDEIGGDFAPRASAFD